MSQTPLSPLRLALVQDAPAHDPQEALARLDRAASEAQGADLLIAPEMWLGGYNIGAARVRNLAAEAEALLEALATLARRHEVAILTGMTRPGPGKPLNSAVLMGGDGRLLVSYDKTHLFGDVDRAQFSPGKELSRIGVVKGWRVGMAICFDIEFPETARSLALAGADLIAVPTANMMPFDSVATRLVPTRAEENGLFVAYANYCGTEPPFGYCGLSCVCGPDGEDIARAGRDPALLRATLQIGDIAARRGALDYLSQLRRDIY